ncbi:MAG: DUF4375 domain-containing protein [Planctomycetaceae bacterium]|nr:DUF4375 domain-containing protein [Planctomycetaceae bacterium]
MSPLARRGRMILLILVTIIVTERLIQHGIALHVLGWEGVGWRKTLRVCGELLLAGYVWWCGDRIWKWLFCIQSLVNGAVRLYLIAKMIQMAWLIGKLAKMPATVNLMALASAFGPEILLASMHVVAAVAVVCLPSVRAFLAYQQREAHWKKESIDNVEKWLASVRARPQYERLTLDLLRSLDGPRLLDVIRDHILLTTDGEYDAIAKLSPGHQMIYAISQLEAEVNNGGFHQYFWNTRGKFIFMVVEGYRQLRHEQNLRLALKSIESFFGEEAEQANFQTDRLDELLDKYQEARENSRLPDLDKEPLASCEDELIAYAQAHLSEFVTR